MHASCMFGFPVTTMSALSHSMVLLPQWCCSYQATRDYPLQASAMKVSNSLSFSEFTMKRQWLSEFTMKRQWRAQHHFHVETVMPMRITGWMLGTATWHEQHTLQPQTHASIQASSTALLERLQAQLGAHGVGGGNIHAIILRAAPVGPIILAPPLALGLALALAPPLALALPIALALPPVPALVAPLLPPLALAVALALALPAAKGSR